MIKKNIILAITVLFLIFVIALVAFIYFGPAADEIVNPEAKQSDGENDTLAEVPDKEPISEPDCEPVSIPEPQVEPEASETPLMSLHSGLRADGSFDSGTLFIGDSLTLQLVANYLAPNELIGDARYFCKSGGALTLFFSETKIHYDGEGKYLFSPEFLNMSFYEAAAAYGEEARAIYFMMGTNVSPYVSDQTYIEVVDYLLEVCPNATVHLQLVPYATAIPYEPVNDNIYSAYEHYEASGEGRVMLVDTFTAIGENLIFDGVHLNDLGRELWYNAILAHAEENGLSQ